MNAPTIFIAGGGTGGHLFPGLALAEELRDAGVKVIFVGTARGIEARILPRDGWPLELIDVGGLRGAGVGGALKGLLRVPRSILQSRALIRKHRPQLVVGVGGYASGPVCLAAWLGGLPVVVMEQNSVPGFTNKILAKLAKRTFLTFSESSRFFPKRRCRLVGNPVRKRLSATGADSATRPAQPFVVFVFGGSQGARALNEAIAAMLPHLGPARAGLRFVHQTGEKMVASVEAAYREAGVDAEVHAFIDDMGAVYRRAHLVISRAGATTLSELTLCAKAAILVPFPFAVDNHQEHNARALVEAGAALLIREKELRPEALAQLLRELRQAPERIAAMEAAARTLATPNAAQDIARDCLALARGERLLEAA